MVSRTARVSVARRDLQEKPGPEAQEPNTRRSCGVRRRISSKPEPYPERKGVDTAGIRVRVDAHYPGRSVFLPERSNRHREGARRGGRSQQRA